MKKKILSGAIILMMIMLGSTCMAATGDSYQVAITSNKTQIKAGETITLQISLKNIHILSGEKGIGAYSAKLEYDNNVFEKVEVKGNSQWDTPLLQNGEFVSVRTDGTCSSLDQEIATIALTAKENITSTSTMIKVTNFQASNAVEKIGTSDAVLLVAIQGKQDNNGNNNNNNNQITNEVVNETTNEVSNTIQNEQNNSQGNTQQPNQNKVTNTIIKPDNTTKDTKLPQTGDTLSILMIATMITVGIVAIVVIVKYKMIKK